MPKKPDFIDPHALHSKLTAAAKQHGEDSEPDHEVGDLQDALELALVNMSQESLRALQGDPRWQELMGWGDVASSSGNLQAEPLKGKSP